MTPEQGELLKAIGQSQEFLLRCAMKGSLVSYSEALKVRNNLIDHLVNAGVSMEEPMNARIAAIEARLRVVEHLSTTLVSVIHKDPHIMAGDTFWKSVRALEKVVMPKSDKQTDQPTGWMP